MRGERFGENVSLLLMCWNPLQVKDAIRVLSGLHIRKEMVELDSNVFGPWPQLRSVGKLNATSIVFKTLGKDLGLGKLKVNAMLLEFLKKMKDEEDLSGGLAEGNALGFHSAESNEFLLLG